MKRLFTSLSVIVASMIAFSGCTKEEIKNPVSETKTVQFVAESIETKTAFGTPDGTTYPTLWTENDKKIVLALNGANSDVNIEVAPDFKTARFNAEVEDDGSGSYQFFALSPSTAKNNISETVISANIWTSQTPLENSVDEAAQVLYSVSETYQAIPSTVSMTFKHFTAYGNLSFENLNLGEAVVNSVAITSSTNIAGRWNYVVESGEYVVNSGSSTITLTTAETENLWFACAPVGSMEGETLTFTINTDNGTLSKKVTLTSTHKFEAGKIAKMVVDMADIAMTEPVVYELVTNVDELTPDSKVIIVAAESNVALSTTQNSNNRGEAGVTKSNEQLTIENPSDAVQILTIEEGNSTETIAFYTGTGYLYAASSGSNYLRTETNKSDNSSWSVTIENGIATVKAQGANTRNWLRYNSNSKMFSCYASGQNDISIYKRQGTGSAPLPKLTAPVVTAELNGDETGINVSWQAVENATSYVISGIGDDVETTETSYSFEELSSGTYNVTVTAKADGYKSATSAAVSATIPYVNTGSAKTYTFTITKDDFNTSSYANNNNDKITTATSEDGSTIDVTWTSYQVMQQSSTMQWQKSKGYIYNKTNLGTIVSVTIDSSTGTFTTYKGTEEAPATNVDGGYFQIKVGSAIGKVDQITVVFQI